MNVAYDLTDDVLAYVQVAEGFRAGGPNDQTAASIANVQIPAGFGSDSIINYELGLKTSLLGRRLTLNGAIYQIDWEDIQVSQFANSASGLRFSYRGNGGKAQVRGVELEMTARPSESLQFGVGLAYTDSKLEENLPIPTKSSAIRSTSRLPRRSTATSRSSRPRLAALDLAESPEIVLTMRATSCAVAAARFAKDCGFRHARSCRESRSVPAEWALPISAG